MLQKSLCFGYHSGHSAAEDAADNAGPIWREFAYQHFLEYARDAGQFVTGMARQYAEVVCGLEPPPDSRAWGAIAKRAQRAGLIVDTGRTMNFKTGSSHPTNARVWEWVQDA